MKKFPGKTPGLYQPNVPTYNIEWIRMFLREKHNKILLDDEKDRGEIKQTK